MKMRLRLNAFLLAAICLLALMACMDRFSNSTSIPKLTWHGVAMVLQDSTVESTTQGVGRKTYFLKSSPEFPDLECRVTRFETEWDAQWAWQIVPGQRKTLLGSVFSDGWYAMVGGENLIRCRGEGHSLLPQENWAESFRWGGLPVHREPTFSQVFLQQNRLEYSGLACPKNYLGAHWSPPIYGMRYVLLQDTIQALIAGPQDSLFLQKNGNLLGIPSQGQKGSLEGIETHLLPGGIRRWWKWGPQGWVGLEGCSIAPKCSLWVEKQYEVLQIFERDGFFSLKNAIGN